MKKKQDSDPELFSSEDGETLIDRMNRDELSNHDQEVIAKIIRAYVFVGRYCQEAGTTIRHIRSFFFGGKNSAKKTKKLSLVKGAEESEPKHAESKFDRPLTEVPSDDTRKKSEQPKAATTGHGRLSADDYTGAEQRQCQHDSLQAGDTCPECGKGKLYSDKPKKQIRLHGQAPVAATCWEVEVLRCAGCKAVINARDPSGKYDDSVKTSIVLSRYYLGLPFHRLEEFQRLVGVPLPDATQWDLTVQLFNDVQPIIGTLIEQAAQASLIYHDDTRGRILSLMEENKTLPGDARYGIHSTGFVTVGQHTIILYFTGRCHAGENIDKLLDLRSSDLDKPIQMSDASSSNTPKRHKNETINCYCNAHAVRKFKDIVTNFPGPCDTILNTLSAVFENDRQIQAQNKTPEQRQAEHAERSGPLLNDLKAWMECQLYRDLQVEPNSSLGQAMNYMLNRWEAFTRFLTVPGVPLDNNIVERIVKRLIFQRKNSFFYANEYSAYVGCALTGLIMTSIEAGINVFDYLNCLQANRFWVARTPEDWLPWNYQEQASLQAQVA